MQRFIAIILCVLLGSIAFGISADNGISPEQQARAVTLQMFTDEKQGKSTCSLVVIAPGEALTANHCQSDKKGGGKSVVIQGDKILPVTAWARYPGTDMTKITVPGLACPCAVVSREKPQQDQPVFVVGYPHGLAQVLTRGEVQSYIVYENERLLLLTADVAGGNSGGGAFLVYGGKAYLLGIVSRGSDEGHLSLVTEVAF